jgi:hypothetical protein
MLLISEWYLELGLSFAAKYYAMAVAFIAGTDIENNGNISAN